MARQLRLPLNEALPTSDQKSLERSRWSEIHFYETARARWAQTNDALHNLLDAAVHVAQDSISGTQSPEEQATSALVVYRLGMVTAKADRALAEWSRSIIELQHLQKLAPALGLSDPDIRSMVVQQIVDSSHLFSEEDLEILRKALSQ